MQNQERDVVYVADEWTIDIAEVDRLANAVKQAGDRAEGIVNGVLHTYAGKEIKKNIQILLPVSGRRWKGKAKAAKTAQPFREDKENLSIIVKTKTAYHYLYFPNDGSNTEKHYGNQRFMYKGAEKAAPDIIEWCTAKLLEEIGG